jgi:predicted phage baseplate assembly protein
VSGAWWGKEASAAVRAGHEGAVPELLPGDRPRLLAVWDGRRDGFTPEWTARGPDDAGMALRQMFGEQLEAVAQRLNRWPAKALTSFLDGAGIEARPGAAAEALLTFEIADTAPNSVLVAAGFQAGARFDGVDGIVIFETQQSLNAAPGKLGEVYRADRGSYLAVDPTQPFAPFGDPVVPGAALLIGFAAQAVPTITLSLGIGVAAAAGTPPPVGAGGVAPLPVPPGPALAWEILDGGQIVALDVIRDETAGLTRGGIIEFALPPRWGPAVPPGLTGAKSVRWLRLRIAYGSFAAAPWLTFLLLNMTRALGARTILDEIPAPVAGSDGRRFRLSQVPIVPGSLLVDVDDSGLGQTGPQRWTSVQDLSIAGPDAPVYQLDETTGELLFGEGLHGRALPQGYRNVHATRYLAQSTVPDVVQAGAISVPVTPLAFVNKVTNPFSGSGGGPGETAVQVLQRGPLEIRTRERAVTPADYALLALRAAGARVARAFAVTGLHPGYPGASIPGVVGIFVVPPDLGGGQAPVPDEETLRGVASSLAASAAPAGVEVVAAAPAYKNVRVEVGVLLEDAADAGATATAVLATLNTYLHPLTGGEGGDGWPFGGAIGFVRLILRVTGVAGVRAAPRLNVVLDGVRQPTCQDIPIDPNALLWPSGHQVYMLDPGAVS